MFRRKRSSPKKQLEHQHPLIEVSECIESLNDCISEIREQLYDPQRDITWVHNVTRYIKFDADMEDRIVELIRRIAELAVQGEQKYSTQLAKDDLLETASGKSNGTSNDGSIGGYDNTVFEYFCEMNVVSIIINIATGAAFHDPEEEMDIMNQNSLEFERNLSTDTNDAVASLETSSFDRCLRPGSSDYKPTRLPPTRIAIQAIQSISIVIQNVKMSTSLYLLLSNNKVNDLINLPLDAYAAAEKFHLTEYDKASAEDSSYYDSTTDISELTNIFVTFLKSLAMKMNRETLQFYLSYPAHQEDGSLKSESRKEPEIDFSTVQFPLYERALTFCNPDEDPFVRITAMNLCLNTLGLATDGDPLSPDNSAVAGTTLDDSLCKGWKEMELSGDTDDDRPDRKTNPAQMSKLPFRERLAISHYVCEPSRVQALSAGIFTQLASLCGKLEEAIRSMEQIDRALSASFLAIDESRKYSARDKAPANIEEEKKKIEALQSKRIKVVKRFLGDLVSDFQDELFLLEDILQVGLVPLNEQIIEMMFPTVIYPLVLTPLHNFIRQNTRSENSGTNEPNPFGENLAKHMSRPVSRGTSTVECDSSLAKSALFVIASIFHFISHKELLHLLLTVLLHPLTPELSNADTVTQPELEIVYITKAGYTHIKTDELREENGFSLYRFGRSDQEKEGTLQPPLNSRQDCVFVFSPILQDMFEWSMTGQPCEISPELLKPNRYRRTLLSCLSGTDGMAELQSLAVYAIDAIVSTLGRDVLDSVIFGSRIHEDIEFTSLTAEPKDCDESITSDSASVLSISATSNFSSSMSNHMIEFVASMCVSIINATISYDGMWSLRYNPVAAHAIYCASMIDYKVKDTAVKFIRHRQYQSGRFVHRIPSRLDMYSNGDQKEIDSDLKMDKIFFEAFCDGDSFVVESTTRKQGASAESLWDGPGCIAVAKDGNMLQLAKQICEDISAKHIIGHDCEEAAYRCGANSALSHIQLGKSFPLLFLRFIFSLFHIY